MRVLRLSVDEIDIANGIPGEKGNGYIRKSSTIGKNGGKELVGVRLRVRQWVNWTFILYWDKRILGNNGESPNIAG